MNLLIISSLLTISLILNVYLAFKLKKTPQIKTQSLELQEFLHDLMGGKMGIFAVSRINSDDLMLRSPRLK